MKTQLLCTIALTVVATTHASAAPDKFELVGKDVSTAVSGYAGGWETLGTDGNYQGLHTILWGEKTDDPCGMYVITSHINNFSSVMLQYDLPDKDKVSQYVFGDFNIVTNAHRPYFEGLELRHVEEVKLDCNGDKKLVSAIGSDSLVYKIQVCTTDKRNTHDNKLKGIKFWTRSLTYRDYKPDDKPILINQQTPQQADHAPHCDKWHTPVQCDSGEIATRLVVHHNATGHRDWVTGLALMCKKVRLKESPSKLELQTSPTVLPQQSSDPRQL